jgi:K+-transporting ATPase ATPase A chain
LFLYAFPSSLCVVRSAASWRQEELVLEEIMLDALVLAIGRFPRIAPMRAAAAPATKMAAPPSSGSFASYRGLFVALLAGVVLIAGGLNFFLALALGSVAGHLALRCGLLIGLLGGIILIIGGLAFVPAFPHIAVAGHLATPAVPLS